MVKIQKRTNSGCKLEIWYSITVSFCLNYAAQWSQDLVLEMSFSTDEETLWHCSLSGYSSSGRENHMFFKLYLTRRRLPRRLPPAIGHTRVSRPRSTAILFIETLSRNSCRALCKGPGPWFVVCSGGRSIVQGPPFEFSHLLCLNECLIWLTLGVRRLFCHGRSLI